MRNQEKYQLSLSILIQQLKKNYQLKIIPMEVSISQFEVRGSITIKTHFIVSTGGEKKQIIAIVRSKVIL